MIILKLSYLNDHVFQLLRITLKFEQQRQFTTF